VRVMEVSKTDPQQVCVDYVGLVTTTTVTGGSVDIYTPSRHGSLSKDESRSTTRITMVKHTLRLTYPRPGGLW